MKWMFPVCIIAALCVLRQGTVRGVPGEVNGAGVGSLGRAAPHTTTTTTQPTPPCPSSALCRQPGACGMADMQLAYEGHYFGLQRCYAFKRIALSLLPPRLKYIRFDTAEFPRLLTEYNALEELLMGCMGDLRTADIEKVYGVLHYPTALLKIPKDLGEYEKFRPNSSTPGRAKLFVHSTWKTMCVAPFHNHLASWRAVDPEQQVVFWTDDAIRNFIETHFLGTKLDITLRRIRHLKGNQEGVMIADLFRALLMLVFGGIYADTDVLASQPWEHIFSEYDVVAASEALGERTPQGIDETWKEGMRAFYGGSYIMTASKPGLSYWESYVNNALDELNRKSNSALALCNPVQCTGPRMTADRHYEFVASHGEAEVRRVVMLDEKVAFKELTGFSHSGHCSWCGAVSRKEVTSRFDLRAALPASSLLLPPGTRADPACPYEKGMVATFDPFAGRTQSASIEVDVSVRDSEDQHRVLEEAPVQVVRPIVHLRSASEERAAKRRK